MEAAIVFELSRKPSALSRVSSRRRREGLTILELLVVVTILGLLIGLLLPAVQRARESARRVQCASHLHQIGTACLLCQDATGRLPPGWIETPRDPSGWGWAARILPHLEQAATAEEIRFNVPIGAACHEAVRRQVIALYRCPSDHLPDWFMLEEGKEASPLRTPLYELASASYVGMFGVQDPDESPPESGNGTFIGNRAFRTEDLRNGSSNTLLVGERTGWLLPSTWVGMDLRNEEGPGRIVGCANLPPNHAEADECEFSSRHIGGAQFVFGDGRVEMVSDHISLSIYRRMANRL
jgi:prepilin-type processing-associated H-X9-DG protein